MLPKFTFLISDPVLVTSPRGDPVCIAIAVGGHQLYRQRSSSDGRTRWCCWKPGCTAFAFTFQNTVEKCDNIHNHPPIPTFTFDGHDVRKG